MSEPTLYFPENIYYRIGLTQGRLWNTTASPSPHGRTQRRKMWLRPKRQMQAVIYPSVTHGFIFTTEEGRTNDPGVPPLTLTEDDVWAVKILPFLDAVAGRYQNFYIFDPVPRTLFNHRVGHWNGGSDIPAPVDWPADLPFKLDFRGSFTGLSNVQVAHVETIVMEPVGGGSPLVYTAPDLVITQGAGGQETVLLDIVPTISPDPAPSAGLYNMIVSATGAHERIPVVMVDDRDDFAFDWANARQPSQLVINIEEDFG